MSAHDDAERPEPPAVVISPESLAAYQAGLGGASADELEALRHVLRGDVSPHVFASVEEKENNAPIMASLQRRVNVSLEEARRQERERAEHEAPPQDQ